MTTREATLRLDAMHSSQEYAQTRPTLPALARQTGQPALRHFEAFWQARLRPAGTSNKLHQPGRSGEDPRLDSEC
jgi:hypothetical protein